ncbi:hypothetical protein F5878DRAFT_729666 [Lentinula raphanica]|uniref:F-box domain-containing protein n=1 Tax=Lentinula raphanica TaxID=153919 RepID=A0AA38NVH4_9AGAR|nr:hypothetical protein F5878DRAFT_729666 [Lentinula raphanica]
MASTYFPSSQSIAQIAWPSERISTRLCDKCNHLIYLDAPLLDFHTILERSRSGYNPTPSERKAYLGMLDEARYEIERRETELRRLQEMIPRLEEQIQLLQAYEAGIKHIISPIQSLPLEILGVIFQYVCCGKDATDIANWCRFGSKNRLPTYDVSRVCIRWNKFVTSMPLLWTSFGSSSSSSVSDAFVQTFIERSRSNLIDFNLSNHTSSRKYTPSPLVAHCNRWCHVSIAGSASVIMNSFLLPLVNKEPLSNLLSLHLDHCNRPRQLVQLPIIFPSLKLLVIRGLSVIFGSPQYTVTTLRLSRVNCTNALLFLHYFPNIESIELGHISAGDPRKCAPVVFDKARTLTLIFRLENAFLAVIKFPHLTRLSLDNSRMKEFEFQPILSLLDQSQCALTSLSIKDVSIRYEELLQLCRRLPSLTHLDVKEPITIYRRANTMRWILELLATPRHPGLQPEGLHKAIVDEKPVSLSNDNNENLELEREDELDMGQQDHNAADADGYLSYYEKEDYNRNLRELLLPQLVELSLVLRPRNELLLDLVHSRRPMLEYSPESDPRTLTDRACLRKLHIRYPQPHSRNPKVLEHFKALQESLRLFEEGGLEVEIEIPVLYS